MSACKRELLVVLTTGNDDGGERATLAFSSACSAAVLGKKTTVFLVGDGTYWGYENHGKDVQQPGFPPLEALINEFIELGGEILVCAVGCEQLRSVLPEGGTMQVRRKSVRPQSVASALAMLASTNALSF